MPETKKNPFRHAAPSILALDLGSQLGFAVLSQGKVVSGTYDMRPAPGQAAGLRFAIFENEFLRQFRAVREVYFEKVRRHEGTHAAHVYGALWGILEKWCYQNDIPCYGREVGDIKKYIAGKGNASKAAVIEAVKQRGYSPEDDNEADALAILSFARHQRG